MTIQLKSAFLSAALAGFILPVAAQTTPAATPAPAPPAQTKPTTIQQRDQNQQDRIANGIKSGELTPNEASHVEGQENKLNNEVKDMREDNGGKLTPAEKEKVTNQENHMSREIYNQKHDAQSTNGVNGGPAAAPTVGGRRMDNQQDRIANGVKNGSLTPGESSRLEKQESNIHNEARNMRQANGGALTQADKQRLNHQQNVESKRINRAKNNGRHQ
jgi:hypothetical protein